MKRSKLCSGVLLVLAIIFGLSLSVSLDTNALKFAYDAIPLYSDVFYFPSTGRRIDSYPGFSISLLTSSGNTLEFNSSLLDINKASFDTCNDSVPVNSHQNIFRSGRNNNPSYSYLNTGIYFTKLKYPFTSTCQGGSNDAFPSSRWSYDHIYTSKYNMTNGDTIDVLDIPRFLFPDGQDGYASATILSMSVPLTLSSDTFSKIPAGTLMEWDFGFLQKSDGMTVNSNVVPKLDIKYFISDPETSSESDFYNSYRSSTSSPSTVNPAPVCTTDFDYRFTVERPDIRENLTGVNFHCSYTAPSDLYYVSPRLQISSSDNSGVLTYVRGDLMFSGSFLTTGGDSTWSGQLANEPVTGDQMENNPSYNQFYGYGDVICNPGDFFCNLSNLFNFTFINPFEPILHLFTNSNQCASIPTIAGMIHSNESTVCPWFSSTVRSIATPVLGLASMMLVFGFAVRWLGSSSGNLFEDSRNEEVSNQGGRWGHFKKGGR